MLIQTNDKIFFEIVKQSLIGKQGNQILEELNLKSLSLKGFENNILTSEIIERSKNELITIFKAQLESDKSSKFLIQLRKKLSKRYSEINNKTFKFTQDVRQQNSYFENDKDIKTSKSINSINQNKSRKKKNRSEERKLIKSIGDKEKIINLFNELKSKTLKCLSEKLGLDLIILNNEIRNSNKKLPDQFTLEELLNVQKTILKLNRTGKQSKQKIKKSFNDKSSSKSSVYDNIKKFGIGKIIYNGLRN